MTTPNTVQDQLQEDMTEAASVLAQAMQEGTNESCNEAVSRWEQIFAQINEVSIDQELRSRILDFTALAYFCRYGVTRQLVDLDYALNLWNETIAIFAGDPVWLSEQWTQIGSALRQRFQHTREQKNLEDAIEKHRWAIELTPDDSPLLPGRLNNLANALSDKYEQTASFNDLETALAHYRRAISATPFGSFELPGRLNNHALGLRMRYQHTGQIDDLEAAIQQYQQAIAQTPSQSVDLPAYLNNLGNVLSDRFERTGSLSDLKEATLYCRKAVELVPPGVSDFPIFATNLGNGLLYLFRQTNQIRDLDEAIEWYQKSLNASSKNISISPTSLNNLANALRDRYEHWRHSVDLEEAIRLRREAVAAAPSTSLFLPTLLSNLGSDLNARYERSGHIEDLEDAITQHRLAVDRSSAGSPDYSVRIEKLANALRNRFEQTRSTADLNEIIWWYRRAIDSTESNPLEHPTLVGNLGSAFVARYEHTREIADLEEAIRQLRLAIALTPAESAHLPSRWNSLGSALRYRHGYSHELTDLEEAIHNYKLAVENTPANSPALPGRLNNLANGLKEQYGRIGESLLLEESIQKHQQAVDLTALDSPELPSRLLNLGSGVKDRYEHTKALADLEEALQIWERVWTLIHSGFNTIPVTYKLGHQQEHSWLYEQLVSSYLQRVRIDPERTSTTYARALEIAEGSKSRLLLEMMSYADVPAPPTAPPELVKQERDLLAKMASLDTTELVEHISPEATTIGESLRFNRLRQRQDFYQQAQDVWNRIAQAGADGAAYSDFRRGKLPVWADLAQLAIDFGPKIAILSLFITNAEIYLFILRNGQLNVVTLDVNHVDRIDIERRFRREIQRFDRTGRRGETWDKSLRPLLQNARPYLSEVERLVFVPHAGTHILPWSVVAWQAGIHTVEGHPLPVITLPALGLVPFLRRSEKSLVGTALVVGNPTSDLLYTEQEARDVAKMLNASALIGQEATRTAVFDRLSQASIIHLATHAFFDEHAPLNSGIVLMDGVLTARDVLHSRLQADLIILSACQTGLSRAIAGDELVGLAQSFLSAGARSLLMSLWNVDDRATAVFMNTFYTAWQTGTDKARAVSEAMTAVKKNPEWTHPYYWGAFILMGEWL